MKLRALALGIALGFVACSFFVDSEGLEARRATSDAAGEAASAADGGTTATDGTASDVVAVTSGYARAVLDDQPIAYFRLDEGVGPIAKDMMGNYDGKYIGAVEFEAAGALTSEANAAIRFPGDPLLAAIELGTDLHLGGSPFTIEFWLAPELIDQEYRRVLIKVDALDAGANGWVIHLHQSVGLIAELMINGKSTYAGTPHDINRYTHVALTFDTVTLRLYLDGVVVSSGVADGTFPATVAQLTVGMHPGGWNFFKGRLDELAFYKSALSSTRVQAHIAAAKQ
jgi:hypothetical protein